MWNWLLLIEDWWHDKEKEIKVFVYVWIIEWLCPESWDIQLCAYARVWSMYCIWVSNEQQILWGGWMMMALCMTHGEWGWKINVHSGFLFFFICRNISSFFYGGRLGAQQIMVHVFIWCPSWCNLPQTWTKWICIWKKKRETMTQDVFLLSII